MPRAIWKGAISFGLVSVPVELFSAVERRGVSFHQISRKTGARVSQKRVDSDTGEEVSYQDLVKGYELEPGRHVLIEPAELEAIAPAATRTIEIEDFVELSQIDPIFYDHPYYLAPARGSARPYRLLLEAMGQTGKVAIAHVVLRSREQLVALRPIGDVLGMSTMVFPDEIIPPGRLEGLEDAATVQTTTRELNIAKQLIESLATDFEPERYHDTYREQLLAMIERKAEGLDAVVQQEPQRAATTTPDLMDALKASVEAVRARDEALGKKPARRPRKPRRAASEEPAQRTPGGSRRGAGKTGRRSPG